MSGAVLATGRSRTVRHAGFTATAIAAAVLLSAGTTVAAAFEYPDAPLRPQTVDLNSGIVHSGRLLSGVPLGGIGAGYFELLTDGSVAHVDVGGSGPSPRDLPGCFAAVWVKLGDRAEARALTLHPHYDVPGVTRLDYDGLYPQATLTFPEAGLPVQITLRAFSPIVPFDIRNSSFPGAVFALEARNMSRSPVEVSVALSWQDMYPAATAMPLPVLSPVVDQEGYYGFLCQSRAPGGGETALIAHPPRRDATVTTAGWNGESRSPPWWSRYAASGDVAPMTAPRAASEEAACSVVAVRLPLAARDSAEVPFAVSWYTPHRMTATRGDVGWFYESLFADAPQAARDLLADWRGLRALTETWQSRLLDSNLPLWLARSLINCAAPLTTDTLHTRDARFAFASPDARVTGGDPLSNIAPPQQMQGSTSLLIAFFPGLMRDYLTEVLARAGAVGLAPATTAGMQQALTAVPPGISAGAAAAAIGRAPPASMRPNEAASTAALMLELLQYAEWTGDSAYVIAQAPALRRLLSAMLAASRRDGLPEVRSSGTETSARTPPTQEVAGLWLAALSAGQRLAHLAGDANLATQCANARARAGRASEARSGTSRRPDQASGATLPLESQSDAYAPGHPRGEIWARALGLPSIAPHSYLEQAIVLDVAPSGVSGSAAKPRAPMGTITPDPNLGVERALLCIDEGSATAGLGVLSRLENIRWNVARTPWLPQAAPDTDGAVAASGTGGADEWNVLAAIEGLQMDLTAGALRVVPNVPGTWRRIAAPIFAPVFRGYIDSKPTAHGGTLSFRLDRLIALADSTATGRSQLRPYLVLKTLTVPGPPPGAAVARAGITAYVSLGRLPLPVRSALRPDGSVEISFDPPVTLSVGDLLEIDVH